MNNASTKNNGATIMKYDVIIVGTIYVLFGIVSTLNSIIVAVQGLPGDMEKSSTLGYLSYWSDKSGIQVYILYPVIALIFYVIAVGVFRKLAWAWLLIAIHLASILWYRHENDSPGIGTYFAIILFSLLLFAWGRWRNVRFQLW